MEGDRKGRKVGYYYRLASRLAEHIEGDGTGRKLTKTDMRLICREIRNRDLFTDPYGSRQVVQEKVFVEIVIARRGDPNRAAVREFVRDHSQIKRKRPRST